MGAHVVIIGAGYALVMAAKRLLRRSSGITVTVVNPRNHFVQRIRLHQMVAGDYDARVPLDRALPSKANLVVGSVTSIDAYAQQLVLDDGRTLRYDFIVYALGSRQSTDPIAGAAANGFTISEFEDLYSAQTLADWGVVNGVHDDVIVAAHSLAVRLGDAPTRAHAATKQIIAAWRSGGVAHADSITPATSGALFATSDLDCAVQRFLTEDRAQPPPSRAADCG